MAQTSRWLHSRLRGMRLTRLRTSSAVVFGFLEAARLGIAAIAGGIRSATAVRRRIKRVDLLRILADYLREDRWG